LPLVTQATSAGFLYFLGLPWWAQELTVYQGTSTCRTSFKKSLNKPPTSNLPVEIQDEIVEQSLEHIENEQNWQKTLSLLGS
jgi:hypothetical protein